MVSFSDDINKEFASILSKRDLVVKTGAVSLFGDLQVNSPVGENIPSRPWLNNPNKMTKPYKGGELRDSWQPPQKLGVLNWRISNIAPHAYVIDGGRRQAVVSGVTKWIGSEQLPNGFDPIIKAFEPKLQRELNKIK